jgi:hypothetical protein
MRTNKKWILLVVFILVTVLVFPCSMVNAGVPTPKFVALGDSTGFGLSAFPDPSNRDLTTLNGFNKQFATYLGYTGPDYANLAWPGDRTCDLLADLDTEWFQLHVASARILTVTIGGNNLLGPSIAAICGLWGIDPSHYVNDLDGKQMLTDLAKAIADRYMSTPGYDPMDDFARLMDLTDPAAQALHAALLQGVADFRNQWPQIAAKIRKLNGTAELYVSTVHNPLQVSGTSDPLYPLYLEFEVLLGAINLNITRYALTYRYRIVDVNRICKNTPGAITFDIAGAGETAVILMNMNPADPAYPATYTHFLEQTDPHPSYIGHVAVFTQMKAVRRNTPFWYWH